MPKEVYDHKGNKYSSIDDICKAYHISRNCFYFRKQRGWPLDKILETPPNTRLCNTIKCIDHNGKSYSNLREMCKFYNINPQVFQERINNGWCLADALTIKTSPHNKRKHYSSKKIYDHLGNAYSTVKDMCSHYGINTSTYVNRISRGWSVEKALLTSRKVPECLRWEKTTDNYSYWYKCPYCNSKAPKNEQGDDYYSPFCPECGKPLKHPFS